MRTTGLTIVGSEKTKQTATTEIALLDGFQHLLGLLHHLCFHQMMNDE